MKLYDHIPFLKKTNERFNKPQQKPAAKKNSAPANAQKNKKQDDGNEKDGKGEKDDKEGKDGKKTQLPKNKNTFEKEITVKADTSIVVTHSKKSRRLIVSAKDKDGKSVKVKYKVVVVTLLFFLNTSE